MAGAIAPLLLIRTSTTCTKNGAICIAAPLNWWNSVSSTNSIGANARKKLQKF
jgi:hypothetical protein